MVKEIIIAANKKIGEEIQKNKEIFYLDHNAEPIDKEKLTEEFIDFIWKLNKNYKLLLWWASSVSSKNQFLSPLYKNIYKLLQIIKILEKSDKQKILLVLEDNRLIKQFQIYCEKKSIKTRIVESEKWKIVKSIYEFKKSLINITYFLISNWVKKYYVSKNLKKLVREKIDSDKSYYVLRTWIDKRSFNKDNIYEKDPYFGDLPGYVKKRKNLMVLVVILKDFKQNLSFIRRNLAVGNTIIPQEFFVNYFDYLKILFQYSKLKQLNLQDVKFRGIDVSYLIQDEIKNNINQGEILNELVYYYVVKNLTKRVKCETFTYTFENHSWEKLTVFGLRKYSPNTCIIGYQHSSVVKKLLNFFLAKIETDIIPFPDKIITVGKNAKNILI